LRRAQMASARARKGTGRAKSVVRKSGSAASKSTRNKNIAKAAVVGTVAAGLIVGGNYVYKNRERLIVAPAAERKFVKIAEKKKGGKLTAKEKHDVKMKERHDHAHRSTNSVRGRLEARQIAKTYKGKSLKPGSKNYFDKKIAKQFSKEEQTVLFHQYRKDVNARARHRFAKAHGKKVKGFDYKSGKQVRVTSKGKVVRQRW